MKLCLNMLMGSLLVSLCETMTLAQACGLRQQDLLETIGLGALAAPIFSAKVSPCCWPEPPTELARS